MDLLTTRGRIVAVSILLSVCVITIVIPTLTSVAILNAQPLRHAFTMGSVIADEPSGAVAEPGPPVASPSPSSCPPPPVCPVVPSPSTCAPPPACPVAPAPSPSTGAPSPSSSAPAPALVCANSTHHNASIAVVTFLDLRPYSSWDQSKQLHMVELTLVSKLLYTHLHSYALFWYDSTHLMDGNKAPHWSKIPVLQHHLESHDWLMWMDADSMFTNFEKRLEDVVDESFDLILTKDMGGLNNGVFLIRRSEWSRRYLQTVWDMYRQFRTSDNPEQTAMKFVAGLPEFAGRVKWVPINVFNSYPSYGRGDWAEWTMWKEGDLVAHLPNTDNRIREKIFGPWVAEQLKKYPPPGYLIQLSKSVTRRRRLEADLEEARQENERLREALRAR